jgi:adenosylmethionine-8-amino-7-oxononanoate aminotransferase
VALKMSIQYWWNLGQQQRRKILAFKNSYHGDTFGAMSVSDRSVFTLAFHDHLFDVIFLDTPTSENIPDILSLIHQHGQDTAAFIYEPLVQGAGGMKMYDARLLDTMLTACKQKGIICIADEVMTGFGRTGKLFASEYMQEKPDIICLSKGLTGGTMALGVTACTQRIYDAYLQDDVYKTFFHGHSFTANPLACTAALASLDLLAKDACRQSMANISRWQTAFAVELKTYANIKNIRTLGTILAFEITSGKDEYLNRISATVTQLALQAGIYLRPLGNTVYLMPPYCLTLEEWEKIKSVVKNILNRIV